MTYLFPRTRPVLHRQTKLLPTVPYRQAHLSVVTAPSKPQLIGSNRNSTQLLPTTQVMARREELSENAKAAVEKETALWQQGCHHAKPVVKMAKPKSLNRALAKHARKSERALDIVRGSVIFRDLQALESFEAHLANVTVSSEDYFKQPKANGLVFKKLILCLDVDGDECLFEIQLHLKDFADICHGDHDHQLYKLSQISRNKHAIWEAQRHMYCPLYEKNGLKIEPGHPCHGRKYC